MMNQKDTSMHQEFTAIPAHYDALMAGVPYRLWVAYIREILKNINYYPISILDVACGTGTVSEYLDELGYDVTGVDISPGMIEIAKQKAEKRRSRVEYFVQDAAEMSIDNRFDLAICLFDSLIYLTEESQLATAMRRVAQHLVDGGYFIFDVNTEYALAHGFFNQSNIGSGEYPKYIWNSSYDHKTRICTVKMVFEVLENNEKRQFTEVHYQKAYQLSELKSMLYGAGFEVTNCYQAYKFRVPTRRSDRVFFVARKR